MFRELLKENNISVEEYMNWKKLYYGNKPNEHQREFYDRILFSLAEMYTKARAQKLCIRELENIFSRDELKKIKFSTTNQKAMNKKNAKKSISC